MNELESLILIGLTAVFLVVFTAFNFMGIMFAGVLIGAKINPIAGFGTWAIAFSYLHFMTWWFDKNIFGGKNVFETLS